MKQVLIWDVPTRMCHWLLAAGCLAAFGLAYAAPERSMAFDAHMLLGVLLLPLLAFRILWGFVGTRHVRFSSFLHRPQAVTRYLRDMLTGKASRYVGHNPTAGYAMMAMNLALVAGIASGLMITDSKLFEEVHEAVSALLLCLIGAHLLGVVVHIALHKENLIICMLHGRKAAEPDDNIGSPRPLAALALFLLTTAWAVAIIGTYDYQGRKIELPLLGTSLHLPAEKESSSHSDDD